MDKNRAVMILIVVVFVSIIVILYALFTSNRGGPTEVDEVQTFEEGYTFDINNDINAYKEDALNDLNAEIITQKDEIKIGAVKESNVKSKITEASSKSPETGSGFIAIVIALALAATLSIFVYKKQ